MHRALGGGAPRPAEQPHAEPGAEARHLRADRTEAHDAERLAAQLHPDEAAGLPLALARADTALSLGCVEGDEIVCAYHGWRYRGDGACTAIPQLADPTRVPARARAVAYAVEEPCSPTAHGSSTRAFS